ncbi:MAG: hypothetical protein V1831_01125 [Candidatus Woesearchaeota archaeon]
MTEEKNHEHKEHHTEHKHLEGITIKKSDMWKIATALAVLLLIISIFTGGFRGNKEGITGVVSADKAAQSAIDYINNNLIQSGTPAALKDVSESSGVYTIGISVGSQDYVSYVTKDGKMLFVEGMDITQEAEKPTTQPQPTQGIQKSDKPEVELFVMSHCPYGTQAEKGIIPAVKALGDTIDFKIRFVYYAMHGETEVKEELRQYCIQKEQNDKFLDYLTCFLKGGESEPCLTEAKVNVEQMNNCVKEADKEFEISANLDDKSKWLGGNFPKFNIDAGLNSKYGVGGSPTLVINGAQVSSSRDSASFLKTICDSFNNAPGACNEEFSSAQPSPGFGFGESDSAIAATCG